jgi:hypothetical protein
VGPLVGSVRPTNPIANRTHEPTHASRNQRGSQ